VARQLLGSGHKGTGVPSWESKLVIEDDMKSLRLPLTIYHQATAGPRFDG
jgi:hypothetical protein